MASEGHLSRLPLMRNDSELLRDVGGTLAGGMALELGGSIFLHTWLGLAGHIPFLASQNSLC